MWMSEAQKELLLKYRSAMDRVVDSAKEDVAALNNIHILARIWVPGVYEVGDVREYNAIPYRCIQAHDSTANVNWTPENTQALWMQYHGTTPETARPWVQPLGSEDRYKMGEYMIWTDGQMYKCLQDTNFSPAEYAQAWEVV